MKKVFTVIGLMGFSITVLGTSANANPIVARPVSPAPSEKKAEPSPSPPGTIGYGVPGAMTFRQFPIATRQWCTSNQFGGDPAPGKKKACYAADGVTKLADEGDHVTIPGPPCREVTVKYVALNGPTVERSFCAGRQVRCSNEVFGKDPSVGVVKHCTLDARKVAEEHQTFSTGAGEACLCNGKTLDELRFTWLTIENTNQY